MRRFKITRGMRLGIVLLVTSLIAAGAWTLFDYRKHRIIVTLPDGSPAPCPSVTLDYNPIYDYHPTRLEGRDGVIYIPRKKAYGRGWEIMWIHSNHGGKRYGASRDPSECVYPMTVALKELPPMPLPPPHSTLEKVGELLDLVRQIAK